MLKVTGTPPEFEVKRLNLEGLVIEWTCPQCGTKHSKRLESDTIKFSVTNRWRRYHLSECLKCFEQFEQVFEWEIEIKPVLMLEVRDPDPKRETF